MPPHNLEGCFGHHDLKIKDDIKKRVNCIVDSKIARYVLQNWANGKPSLTKYARTSRMIVVCWVLVNMFDCVIKGGFVRDWVVNAE